MFNLMKLDNYIKIQLLTVILIGLNANCFALRDGNFLATSSGSYISAATSVPFLAGSGNYDFDGTSSGNPAGSWQITFHTYNGNSYYYSCPPNYTPYVMITPVKTWGADGGRCMTLTVANNGISSVACPFPSICLYGHYYSVTVNKTYGGDSGGIAFSWALYCYPPGAQVPTNMSNSNNGC